MDDFEKRLEKISELPRTKKQIVLAALLAKLFQPHRVSLTVVGGAAVQFHTQAAYVTKDVDAVLIGDTREIIEEVMGKLGFKRTTMFRHFEHPLFDFVVEFPPSPVEVGGRYISQVALIETPEGPVRVIRVEDIIMDRIIAAVEWKDKPSLRQAKLLWRKNRNSIDQAYLTDFATDEDYLKTLKEVMKV